MSIDHALLPQVGSAKLPTQYIAAKQALAECSKIDECKTWADKAQAMASYAKQADDDSLHKLAIKIKARAIRRCGELLKEIEPGRAGRPAKSTSAPTQISRSQVARDAGLSQRQKETALRVASVPDDEFEAAVESESPPTVTELAKRGTKPRPKPLVDIHCDPAEFALATRSFGLVEDLAQFATSANPAACARGELPVRRQQLIDFADTAIEWLRELVFELTDLGEEK